LLVTSFAAGIPAFDISRFMGHSKPTTTLGIYVYLFEDNHADAMAALGAIGQRPADETGNVVRLRRHGAAYSQAMQSGSRSSPGR